MPDWIQHLVLPPGGLLVMGLLGIALIRRWPRTGRNIALAAMAALWLLSTNRVSSWLMQPLENSVPVATSEQWTNAGAIVVLGGGRLFGQPQLGGRDDVTPMALQRLADAARIHRRTGLPILTSGGGGQRGTDDPPEADLMAWRLQHSFGVPTRWREIQSHDTAHNARYSARILGQAGIDTVVLVTTAWHMPRAARNFRQQGLKVLAAPTGFTARSGYGLSSIVPNPRALRYSFWALHEYLGLLAGR
ncbi:YdcF family protein [Kushneria phosphatilytica]|uniref:YdcF family protein n=1 Tax=Kushneria phosphatilytica TaxID=657387 RepID=A0A1S1NXX6_9GAMM|nr:YdcF family protein [Kushneria phosphatilytica]OHV12318.1 hypothetical protein BH688_06780 [Kushneria phosphatilytica]QEL11525.1 YdcF family protein [Kushneria phosphatilytica]